MIYYLAGPMRGLPLYNFPAFHEAAAALRAEGHVVYSPAEHDLSLGIDPTLPLDQQPSFDLRAAWRWDVERILESEGIALLPGHERSGGATLERKLARKLGLVERLLEGPDPWPREDEVSLRYAAETNAVGRAPTTEPRAPVRLDLLADLLAVRLGAMTPPWYMEFHCASCGALISVSSGDPAVDSLSGIPCSACGATYAVERKWDSPWSAHGEVTP